MEQSAPPAPAPLAFDSLFAAEDRHFWFRARNQVIATVVGQLLARLPDGYRILEVGCGTGYVLRELERLCTRGEAIGLDLFAEGLHYARQRTGCRLVQADLHHMPFETPFDVIGMFDVLEHLPDDRRVLRELSARLAPGGALVLTVPAHRRLWSYFDVAAQHYRRYAPEELREALLESGFTIEYLTQFMAPLYPLLWLARRGRSGNRERACAELRIVPGLNGFLSRVLACELPLIARRCRLPIGTSLLAIARKTRRHS